MLLQWFPYLFPIFCGDSFQYVDCFGCFFFGLLHVLTQIQFRVEVESQDFGVFNCRDHFVVYGMIQSCVVFLWVWGNNGAVDLSALNCKSFSCVQLKM